ncbi:MAG: PaaI family thioesterase [Acidimicrobiales bacterium]
MLTDQEQQQRRDRFREHWQHGVAFNRMCGITVRQWDPDGVELHLPYRDDLSAHDGIFHGGVVSALIDTAGCGAVAAGHDYANGSRITTISMAVQYLTVAPGEDIVAIAHCTRRGKQVNYSDVVVKSADSDKELARGLVTVSVSGERRI